MSTTPRPEPASQSDAATQPPIQWPATRSAPRTDNERAAAYARAQVSQVYQQSQRGPSPEEPVAGQTDNEAETTQSQGYDWQNYHAAWQQYYQQYFHKYYTHWWQQSKRQLAAEQGSAASAAQAAPEQISEQEKIAGELRTKIRSTVETQAKKVHSSSHFKPVLAALTVGLLFLFVNYNQVIVGAVKQYVTPGSVVTTPVIVEPNASVKVGKKPLIIIPKIGVEADVIYDEPRVDEDSFQRALDKGVVRLGNTPDPGTKGNTVIGGHSSNNIFNIGKYKYVFVNLKRLSTGDIIYLHFEGARYTYRVTERPFIVAPTEVDRVLAQTEKPTLTLFTCDPPGSNVNRMIVKAEQIDPDPGTATTSTNQPTTINEENPLPSVAPSIWSRIFGRD